MLYKQSEMPYKQSEMPHLDHKKSFFWKSRLQYIMALCCQTLGASTFISLPTVALSHGAAGYLIGYVLTYVLVGIPLLYMEFVVSQFTARDCLQVWTIRKCLSHIGYIYILWQIIILIYNHTMISFITHYFLISFEEPVPYHVCGNWSTQSCNILLYNYTVNQDCIKSKDNAHEFCENLYKSFPAFQYWRYFILGQREKYYYVAWRVCLASGLACSILFLSCFKRKRSLKWFLSFLTFFPISGYTLLMIGSMMQKGVVSSYAEAIDADFRVFVEGYRISNIIQQVLYSLNIGTGLSFNLGASTSFRAPCYSNIVITVAICVVFTVIAVCTIPMMLCPFAYVTGIKPNTFVEYQMGLIFEKIPTLLKAYDDKHLWLVLIFSCNAILGLSTNIIVMQHLLQMLAERYILMKRYPGMTCLVCVTLVFILTTPFLGNIGVYSIFGFRKVLNLVTIFMATIECLVFIGWYGLIKFSEDVHFMQGIQPKSYMKFAWLISSGMLAYVFINELYITIRVANASTGETLGIWTLMVSVGLAILITLLKLAVAVLRKRFKDMIKVDSLWGPKNEVLLRSRAMFSAQAMTKEYIYRQYHLQAGILARQRTSNVRLLNNQ